MEILISARLAEKSSPCSPQGAAVCAGFALANGTTLLPVRW